MNIKGIDVSNNDGAIDFTKVAGDGVEYVYIKATEGKSFKDPYMKEFYKGCKDNNLKVGAYHFLVGTSSPEDQAENFFNMISDHDWDLIPMMDIETNFEGLVDYVVRFINKFNSLSSLKLGIYSYTSFLPYLTSIQDNIKDMPFWEANYNNKPWVLNDNFFTNRIGHQYTEEGCIGGVNCKCDINVFTEDVLLDAVKLGWNHNLKSKWWYCTNIDNKYYYKDSWQEINGEWYYFDEDGYAVFHTWKKGNYDNWYYLKDNCKMAKNEWVWVNGECYYFNNYGAMANSTTIDGYRIGSDGAWVQ